MLALLTTVEAVGGWEEHDETARASVPPGRCTCGQAGERREQVARSFPVQKGDARVRAGEHISVGLGSRGKRKERVRELETSKSKGREGDADAPVRVVARMADTFPSASIRPSLEVRYHMPFNYRYALSVFNPKKLRYFFSHNLALKDQLCVLHTKNLKPIHSVKN